MTTICPHGGPPPGKPKRTDIYLQTLIADKENERAALTAALEHKDIELHALRNELTALWLDPKFKAHDHAHGREKATA